MAEQQLAVGARVEVYWSDDDEYYPGSVVGKAPTTASNDSDSDDASYCSSDEDENNGRNVVYEVAYDDGDHGLLDPSKNSFRILPSNQDEKDKSADLVADLRVGSRLSVYWPLEKTFFMATLKNSKAENDDDNDKQQPHRLVYDDGDKEWTNLKRRKFEVIPSNKNASLLLQLKTGSRVSIHWPLEKQYYPGTVKKIKPQREHPHLVVYDDGDKEWVNLEHRNFELLDGPSPAADAGTSDDTHSKKRKEPEQKSQSTSTERQRKRYKRKTWEERFQELKEVYDEFGHSNVKKNTHPTLCKWLEKQRSVEGRQRLTEERKRLLRSVNFDFRTHREKLDEQWNTRFAEYRQYIRDHPEGSPLDGGYFGDATPQLRTWIQTQQVNYRDGTLRQDRQDLLEEVGFLWVRDENRTGENSPVYGKNDKWDKSFAALKEFQAKNGHAMVQREDDKVLWGWMGQQRKFRRQGTLKSIRVEKLDSIGFIWEIDAFDASRGFQQQIWDSNFDALSTYFQENGHSNVKLSENKTLYEWAKRQRDRYDTLHPSRREKLQQVKFDPYTRFNDEQWNTKYNQLKALHDARGTRDISLAEYAEAGLGNFVGTQRQMYNGKRDGDKVIFIQPERKELLDAIGFVWKGKCGPKPRDQA